MMWMIVAGVLSALAALLHVGCILGGAPWYRFFGAGERMAQMAERGEWTPTLITLGITLVLAIWSAYAFSAAEVLPRLPLMRLALLLITGVYLLRGLALFPIWLFRPQMIDAFAIWSSLICLAFGLVHLIGLLQRWSYLQGD